MKGKSAIPLYLPGLSASRRKAITVLAGDVGGTKTNLALFKTKGEELKLVRDNSYHSSSYASCIDIVNAFLGEGKKEIPDRICLGVAGPVVKGKVEVTNLPWELDIADIRDSTSVAEVSLLNDLEATAYGLAALRKAHFTVIRKGGGDERGNIAIIAPGTGLGEAGLFSDGSAYHPFPTEGGHTDFAPRTSLDIELFQYLQRKYRIVSWEKVISGPGIHDIYLFLQGHKKRNEPKWLRKSLGNEDPSAVISQAALEKKDAVCVKTMQLFVRYLARESSNLVLKLKATGGLFLGGGIPPKIAPLLTDGFFYMHFLDCDRMQHLLKKAPLKIILNNKTALLGAAYYGAFGTVLAS